MKINEKDIFLLLTNKCTIQCFACGYGCENSKNNWFISEEQFTTVLQKLKNANFDQCTRYVINLTGGDPLLHKDWKKFAFLAANMFPDSTCYIGTSGPILATLDDNVIMECHKKNIRFGVTLYPSMKLLPIFEKIEEKFKRLGIEEHLSWNPLRIIFSKPAYEYGKDIRRCFNTNFSELDCCFIYKDAIYNCQSLFYQDMKFNNNNSSFNIHTIPDNYNFKNELSFKDCIHCKLNLNENILWHLNKDVPQECLFKSLKDLFLYDYNNYYLLQHNCKEHIECLNHEFFKRKCKQSRLHPVARIRFIEGKADIFIPFDKKVESQFLNLLNNQNDLEKYNFYLVSYTDDIDINDYMYECFSELSQNIFFLKANNFLNATHIFMQNSYLNKKYCLDINNYSGLINKDFLKNI